MSAEVSREYGEPLEIHFKEGLPGFEHCRKFVLQEEEDNTPFGTLQSLEQEEVRFIVADPFYLYKDYEFELPDNVCQELQIVQTQDLVVRSIVSLRGDTGEASLNLVAPVVVNRAIREGKQVILSNTRYSTRHPLFEPSIEREERG